MKLTSIKAHGFKSFADKTDIELKSNITAIVGPNGSGKSNIVDAVRWVLGEQSVKSLRGSGAMTDCIFSGSKTREPQKRAEVTLVFDNSDHYLKSDFSEIAVKRVVYSTGENEYYINNTKVRLKDVTDLFLDSGVGNESFNIISQGNIEQVVNSKPEDRRYIIESASGVVKYKKRKLESLRKLEKTKDNLEKVGLVIKELETTVMPLKEQSEVAKKYLELKGKLEELEIAFLASDIKEKNSEYQNLKHEIERLEKEVLEQSSESSKQNSDLEKMRLENLKLDEEITKMNAELLSFAEELSKKQSEKDITIERQKYSATKEKINDSLLSIKEEILLLEKQKDSLEVDVLSSKKEKEKIEAQTRDIEEEIALSKVKLINTKNRKNTLSKELWTLQNQIEILENNIQNDAKLPLAVKNVLNHPKLSGIRGTIGKLIEVEESYMTAIDTALGASSNFLVVENESCAKKAIEYLKSTSFGRATFFPMNIIKGRTIDLNIKETLTKETGYIALASELVKYDKEYQNIIENQLGNILVVKDMDAMNTLGKKLSYKYRLVTLDGEILHTGGSMTGGSTKKTNSSLNDKLELEKKKTMFQNYNRSLEEETKAEEMLEKKLENLQEKQQEYDRQIIHYTEVLSEKSLAYENVLKKVTEKKAEEEGTTNLLEGKLDNQLLEIIKALNDLEKENAKKKKELQILKAKKDDITEKIAIVEKKNKEDFSKQNKLEQSLKEKEIRLGKLDIVLDNLLNTLSENYGLTYEKALATYPLELDYKTAKVTVEKLKKEMNQLGTVNLGSIEEYERLNTRFQFLTNQKNDLESSSESLKKVIDEMDEIMKTKFSETFQKVSIEFSHVFQKLFKGGTGILKLTNPDDLLETGIDIIAEPPGKKLNNLALLSGGEKTLTAIALLFAILNVKPVPFCILDEVEAALDEANVDTFGSYLQSKKEKSEFILITHKKRTMEYADTLYGITMQEQGVSKIVSVELENA